MKNLNSEAFAKSKKKNRNLLIIGIILMIITIILIYLGVKNEQKALPDPINLSDIVESGKNSEDEYAYLDVMTKPYLFAVYETDGVEEDAKFYFVMDENNYLYIVYMKEDKYNELNVDSIEENAIRVTGITKKIPNDIKKLAIESYNEIMEDEYLTDENFKDYVGVVYLDMKSSVNDSSMYYLGAFLSGLFSFIIIVTYIVVITKNKKTLKNISEEEFSKIDAEISQMSNSEYSNMKFYLLKDYVVDMSNTIEIIKYSDIIWSYPYEQRYNGLLVNKCIKIIDINNKTHDVANTKFLDKNKDDILQEILRKLQEKNSDIILGFNNENRKIAKEKIKELKNK